MILLFGSLALVSSVFAIYSCEFFSYRTLDGELWEGFEEPFDELRSASVGLFSYSETTTDTFYFFGKQCLDYVTWKTAGQSTMFQVAQWCSIFAPVAAFLAWVQILCESFLCRLRGSYVWIVSFFIFATILQACTFLIFADTDFCFEATSENKCAIKTGAWYSFGSAMAYLILTIIATSRVPKGRSDETMCFGCCIRTSTRGSRFEEDKSRRSGSETSQDGDGVWHSDDGENKDDDESLENWAMAVAAEEAGRSKNSQKKSSSTSQGLNSRSLFDANSLKSGTTTDGTDDQTNLVTQDSSKLISYMEAELKESQATAVRTQVESSARIAAATQQQQSMVNRQSGGPPDFFDTVCCGDPLGVEENLKRGSSRRNYKKGIITSRGGVGGSTTNFTHLGGSTTTYEGGIPVV